MCTLLFVPVVVPAAELAGELAGAPRLVMGFGAAGEDGTFVIQFHYLHGRLHIFFLVHCVILLTLFNYNLFTIHDVEAGLGGHATELATIDGVPCIGIRVIREIRSRDSRALAVPAGQAYEAAGVGVWQDEPGLVGRGLEGCAVGGSPVPADVGAGGVVAQLVVLAAAGGRGLGVAAVEQVGAGVGGRLGLQCECLRLRLGAGGCLQHDGRAGGHDVVVGVAVGDGRVGQRAAVVGGDDAGLDAGGQYGVVLSVVIGGVAFGCEGDGGRGGTEGLAIDGGGGEVAAEDVAVVIDERLPALDADGAVVAVGVDMVDHVGPAEGDGAVAPDAVAVVAGSGDDAAVDGDKVVAVDAVVASSVDDAAVDGDGAFVGSSAISTYTTDSVEGAGLSTLSIEVEVAGRTPKGRATAAIDVHGLAVAEDDVDVAVALNPACVAEAGADEVPFVLVVAAERGLAAVEGDGIGVAALAVGVDVADADGLAGAGEVVGADANRDVAVGHVQRRAVEGAGAGRVAVLVACGCTGGGVRECQAHLVFATVVEGAAAGDALGVGLYAADGVGSVLDRRAYGADGLDGDAVAATDGTLSLTLRGAEGAGVVTVGDGGAGAVAAEGGAWIAGAGNDLGLACAEGGGGIERVGDGDGRVAPAYEAAAVAGAAGGAYGEHLAVEHAALDANAGAIGGGVGGHDAAVCAVAADRAVDGDAADAVGDAGRALHDADESGGVLTVGADGAGGGAARDGQHAAVFLGCLTDERGGI